MKALSLSASLLAISLTFLAGSKAEAVPLRCGELVPISVSVADAAGQPVSDHTLVEFTTNYGGVIASASYLQVPVQPLSSAVAETFGGTAMVMLLTSTTHIGTYEVVAYAASSGGFGRYGPLVVAQTSVSCSSVTGVPSDNDSNQVSSSSPDG